MCFHQKSQKRKISHQQKGENGRKCTKNYGNDDRINLKSHKQTHLCGKLEELPEVDRHVYFPAPSPLSSSTWVHTRPAMHLQGQPVFYISYHLVDYCYNITFLTRNGSFELNPKGELLCTFKIHLPYGNRVALKLWIGDNEATVPKEYNVRRHYTTVHENKHATYTNESRRALVADLKKKLKQQTGMFSKILHSQTHSLHASYAVSLELAKTRKPFTDGNLIKKCAVEMAKAFGDSKMAEKFESVPLSHQTIQRRIVAMVEQVEKSMLSLVKKSSYFSLCLDESTDQTDVSQLLIFVRTTFDDFTSKEELFDICPLYGTTKGKDIYEAVKKTVDRIGRFDKCSAIATDGAPSMTGSPETTVNFQDFRNGQEKCDGLLIQLQDGTSSWAHCTKSGDGQKQIEIVSRENRVVLKVRIRSSSAKSSTFALKMSYRAEPVESVVGLCDFGWVVLRQFCIGAMEGLKLPWAQAEMECARKGGHLVSIRSERDQHIIDNLLVNTSQKKSDENYKELLISDISEDALCLSKDLHE
ncbi:unnamed protein product [Diabrotica balteata]|uniref:DUF4371 domain-containing protein n=1 Tax=Diabrotica balteata TaxID=107213 RepID=A0A9N9X9D9_DIABA|nr:unnamed protein product [Diabrotica balteata]